MKTLDEDMNTFILTLYEYLKKHDIPQLQWERINPTQVISTFCMATLSQVWLFSTC
jgi:hypothetical protein